MTGAAATATSPTCCGASTDSRHDREIVPNLARGLRLTGLDQLWVADVTYIRLLEEFVYLAVIIDAFGRRVVGWAMADHLRASLASTPYHGPGGSRHTALPPA